MTFYNDLVFLRKRYYENKRRMSEQVLTARLIHDVIDKVDEGRDVLCRLASSTPEHHISYTFVVEIGDLDRGLDFEQHETVKGLLNKRLPQEFSGCEVTLVFA